MTATKEDIEFWLSVAVIKEATHLIVAVDTYDHENYPVYVSKNKKLKEEIERISRSSLQSIDEVYNMSLDTNKQLKQYRAMNL